MGSIYIMMCTSLSGLPQKYCFFVMELDFKYIKLWYPQRQVLHIFPDF